MAGPMSWWGGEYGGARDGETGLAGTGTLPQRQGARRNHKGRTPGEPPPARHPPAGAGGAAARPLRQLKRAAHLQAGGAHLQQRDGPGAQRRHGKK